jgi:hypothetical protein
LFIFGRWWGGGFSGAAALTVAHEVLRHTVPNAPRMDLLGERGLNRLLKTAGVRPLRGNALFEATMAGDLLSNAATYAMIGCGRKAVMRGTVLGVALGIGAVVLPGPLGLGKAPSRRTRGTELMTIGLYTLGGLVAGLVNARTERSV